MIASNIHPNRDISSGVQTVTNVSGVSIKNTDVFKQYLEGIRHLARRKQRRCISQELG